MPLDMYLQKLDKKFNQESKFSDRINTEQDFLREDWKFIFENHDDWVIIQASDGIKGIFITATLCPKRNFGNLDKLDPRLFNCPHFNSVFYPDTSTDEKPLYYQRYHCTKARDKQTYFEMDQSIVHLLEVHWDDSRNAFCKLDECGDIEEVIKYISSETAHIIVIKKNDLESILDYGKWMFVRYFKVTRYKNIGDYYSESYSSELKFDKNLNIRYSIGKSGENEIKYCIFKGFQIQPYKKSKRKVKKYLSFIVQDLRNKTILEDYSLDPNGYTNYVENKNNLPYGLSPIFFNAEVLDRYKNNRDKYEITEFNISCRGAWSIVWYDINDMKQVHVMAVHLQALPYKEQEYWKPFNEKPNARISERTIKSLFHSEWLENSEIENLRIKLEQLISIRVLGVDSAIWKPVGGSWEHVSGGFTMLHTENSEEWMKFMGRLANIVVEGFQKNTLKAIATKFGYNDEEHFNKNKNQIGTLGLIKFILNKSGNYSKINHTHDILNDLQKNRSAGSAHGEYKSPDGSLIDHAAKM